MKKPSWTIRSAFTDSVTIMNHNSDQWSRHGPQNKINQKPASILPDNEGAGKKTFRPTLNAKVAIEFKKISFAFSIRPPFSDY